MTDTQWRLYVPEAFSYIDNMVEAIKAYAAFLELSPCLVAGALVEEADTYYSSSLKDGVQDWTREPKGSETISFSLIKLML